MQLSTFLYTFTNVLCILALSATSITHSQATSPGTSPNDTTKATFYLQNGKPMLKMGVRDETGGVAIATFNDTIEQTGWSVLNIKSGFGRKQITDKDIMYAAGFLEGALTSKRIYQWAVNLNGTFYDGLSADVLFKIHEFFSQQDQWMRRMIKTNPKDPYWQMVSLVVAQFDGLVDGYKAMPYQKKHLNLFDFQSINAAGDLLDIPNVVDRSLLPKWKTMTKEEFSLYLAKSGHCSALIKVLPGFEDVFMGHSTWFAYAATVRIFKHYHFNLRMPNVAAKQMSFSSYPGSLESEDDYYIMNSGLVMLQSTNNIFNSSLYELVKPQSLLAWQRVRVANHIARGGKEWANAVSQYNSGTYNNQYMVIDTKKISKEIADDALWVIEQIPGLVESGDQTAILRAGYWASYNIPFYENIYNLSGYPDMKKEMGNLVSHQLAPRAEIFRRDQGEVVDMQSFKHLLRSNDYLNDPYSDKSPCNTICCRGDLEASPHPSGCMDTKVTNLSMAAKMMSYAISGPTRDSNLPAFEWTDAFQVPHMGTPQKYDFDFILTKPAEWQ